MERKNGGYKTKAVQVLSKANTEGAEGKSHLHTCSMSALNLEQTPSDSCRYSPPAAFMTINLIFLLA